MSSTEEEVEDAEEGGPLGGGVAGVVHAHSTVVRLMDAFFEG